MPIPEKDDNISKNFEPYKNKKSILEDNYIEKDYRDLVSKSLNIKSYIRDSF